jgi:N-terminal acetyltransferase B complex non-catalytic subunit
MRFRTGSQVRRMVVIGCPSLALEHYRAVGIKQVQNDTLSHFALSRASTFSLAATGDITYLSECIESSQIYNTNSQEVSMRYLQKIIRRSSDCLSRPPTSLFGRSRERSIPRYVVSILAYLRISSCMQIPDFINFEDRLDNSLARDTVKVEHVRMRIAHEQITTDLIDLELVELKFIFNRCAFGPLFPSCQYGSDGFIVPCSPP